jgi:hypothetical protein
MKKQLMLVAALMTLGSTLGSVAVMAQQPPQSDAPPPPHHDRMFKEADTNGDRALSKAEWQDHHAKKFDEMDANKDGKLTKEELQNFHQARMKEMQEHRQKMKDGKGMPMDGATPPPAK